MDSLTVFSPLSEKGATVTISAITPIVGVPILSVDEVLQVLNLQTWQHLMVTVHAKSAIWNGIHSRVSYRSILPDSTAATRSDMLTGAPDELYDGASSIFACFQTFTTVLLYSLRGPSASCHHDTIVILAVRRRYWSTVRGES